MLHCSEVDSTSEHTSTKDLLDNIKMHGTNVKSMLRMLLSFSAVSLFVKLILHLSDQAQVTLKLSQSFQFYIKILSRSALAGGGV